MREIDVCLSECKNEKNAPTTPILALKGVDEILKVKRTCVLEISHSGLLGKALAKR